MNTLACRSFLLFLLLASPVQGGCDLTGVAWPISVWRDIMRGTAVQVCDQTKIGNGRCDNTNNMMSEGCGMDGGDCCLTTCYANCVTRQLASISTGDVQYSTPSGISGQCEYMCGVQSAPKSNCPYMCLTDDYMNAGRTYTSWCSNSRGTPTPMSECYSTTGQVVSMLLECILDDASHGNLDTGNARCGNQTGDCTLGDVTSKIDGCHLHPETCTAGSCCSTAISRSWIDPAVKTLPSECEVYKTCLNDPDCFSTMAQCGRTNKACRGGCCMCSEMQWYGTNCDQPLCWPKCKNGKCVAPNTCHCDDGYSGESCEIPVCDPPCVGGQGACIAPNVCECFYGWSGDQCQLPKSTPPCINGVAIAPDVCQCDAGWGGRICDYPLCLSYPEPSSDCGHGVCEAPWTCKCDPGWSLEVPAGPDGLSIPSIYWKGRDLTSNGLPTQLGDVRFNGTFFDEYNSFKCLKPNDCQLLFDNKCKSCSSDSCTECVSGYFLSEEGGRCLRCSLKFPRCRQCNSEQCLVCDPLFVLANKRCVSDGIFEFSSDKYNVNDTDEFVEITVLRTVDSLDTEWISSRPPLRVLVTAEPPGRSTVTSILTFSSITDTIKTVRIPIYDNLRIDGGKSSFAVKLVVDSSAISGSPISLLSGIDETPVTEAEVVIHDTRFIDLFSCSVVGFIQVKCTVLSSSLFPPALFAVTTNSLPTVIVSSTDGTANISPPVPEPSVKSFDVTIEAVVPGIISRFFLINSVPVSGQAPDDSRLQRLVNDTWSTGQEAPRVISYIGYLRFSCFEETSLPSSLGLSSSQGSKVSLKVDTDTVAVPLSQRNVNTGDSDDMWQAPLGDGVFCGDSGGVVCYNATWTSDQVLRLNITFEPSLLFLTRPAGIRLMAFDGDSWDVVPRDCLLGGVEVQGSPIRGVENV
jgi:hypothetical protein